MSNTTEQLSGDEDGDDVSLPADFPFDLEGFEILDEVDIDDDDGSSDEKRESETEIVTVENTSSSESTTDPCKTKADDRHLSELESVSDGYEALPKPNFKSPGPPKATGKAETQLNKSKITHLNTKTSASASEVTATEMQTQPVSLNTSVLPTSVKTTPTTTKTTCTTAKGSPNIAKVTPEATKTTPTAARTTPKTTRTTPTAPKTTPVPGKTIVTAVKTTPTATKPTPVTAKSVPTGTKTTPVGAKTTPVKPTPVGAKTTPVCAKTTPGGAKTTPTATKTTPTAAKTTPTAAKTTPTAAKTTPTAAKTTPTTAKMTPTAAKTTPTAAKTTPTVAKTTPTAAKTTPMPAKTTTTATKITPVGTKPITVTAKSVPAGTKTTPVAGKTTPTAGKTTPKTTKLTPVTTKTTPVAGKTPPVAGKTTPTATKTTPTATKLTPVITKTVPAGIKTTPTAAKTTSTVTKLTPVTTKTVPAGIRTTPKAAKTIPTAPKLTTVTAVTAKIVPTGTKTNPVSGKTTLSASKTTPTATKLTPTTAPVAVKTTPVSAKTTPTAVKTTPVMVKPTPVSEKTNPTMAKKTTPITGKTIPTPANTTPMAVKTTSVVAKVVPAGTKTIPVAARISPIAAKTTPTAVKATAIVVKTTPIAAKTTLTSEVTKVIPPEKTPTTTKASSEMRTVTGEMGDTARPPVVTKPTVTAAKAAPTASHTAPHLAKSVPVTTKTIPAEESETTSSGASKTTSTVTKTYPQAANTIPTESKTSSELSRPKPDVMKVKPTGTKASEAIIKPQVSGTTIESAKEVTTEKDTISTATKAVPKVTSVDIIAKTTVTSQTSGQVTHKTPVSVKTQPAAPGLEKSISSVAPLTSEVSKPSAMDTSATSITAKPTSDKSPTTIQNCSVSAAIAAVVTKRLTVSLKKLPPFAFSKIISNTKSSTFPAAKSTPVSNTQASTVKGSAEIPTVVHVTSSQSPVTSAVSVTTPTLPAATSTTSKPKSGSANAVAVSAFFSATGTTSVASTSKSGSANAIAPSAFISGTGTTSVTSTTKPKLVSPASTVVKSISATLVTTLQSPITTEASPVTTAAKPKLSSEPTKTTASNTVTKPVPANSVSVPTNSAQPIKGACKPTVIQPTLVKKVAKPLTNTSKAHVRSQSTGDLTSASNRSSLQKATSLLSVPGSGAKSTPLKKSGQGVQHVAGKIVKTVIQAQAGSGKAASSPAAAQQQIFQRPLNKIPVGSTGGVQGKVTSSPKLKRTVVRRVIHRQSRETMTESKTIVSASTQTPEQVTSPETDSEASTLTVNTSKQKRVAEKQERQSINRLKTVMLHPMQVEDLGDPVLQPFILNCHCLSARFLSSRKGMQKKGHLEIRYFSEADANTNAAEMQGLKLASGKHLSAKILGECGPWDGTLDEWHRKTIVETEGLAEARCAYIHNLPAYTTEEMLRILFPEVLNVTLVLPKEDDKQQKGYAVLEFLSPEEAEIVAEDSKTSQMKIGENKISLALIVKRSLKPPEPKTSEEKTQVTVPDSGLQAQKTAGTKRLAQTNTAEVSASPSKRAKKAEKKLLSEDGSEKEVCYSGSDIKQYLFHWSLLHKSIPKYTYKAWGPSHRPMFRCEATIDGMDYIAGGTGTSKRIAQNKCAYNYVKHLIKEGKVKESSVKKCEDELVSLGLVPGIRKPEQKGKLDMDLKKSERRMNTPETHHIEMNTREKQLAEKNSPIRQHTEMNSPKKQQKQGLHSTRSSNKSRIHKDSKRGGEHILELKSAITKQLVELQEGRVSDPNRLAELAVKLQTVSEATLNVKSVISVAGESGHSDTDRAGMRIGDLNRHRRGQNNAEKPSGSISHTVDKSLKKKKKEKKVKSGKKKGKALLEKKTKDKSKESSEGIKTTNASNMTPIPGRRKDIAGRGRLSYSPDRRSGGRWSPSPERQRGSMDGGRWSHSPVRRRGSMDRDRWSPSPERQRGSMDGDRWSHSPVRRRGSMDRDRWSHSPVRRRGSMDRDRWSHSPVRRRGSMDRDRWSPSPDRRQGSVDKNRFTPERKADWSDRKRDGASRKRGYSDRSPSSERSRGKDKGDELYDPFDTLSKLARLDSPTRQEEGSSQQGQQDFSYVSSLAPPRSEQNISTTGLQQYRTNQYALAIPQINPQQDFFNPSQTMHSQQRSAQNPATVQHDYYNPVSHRLPSQQMTSQSSATFTVSAASSTISSHTTDSRQQDYHNPSGLSSYSQQSSFQGKGSFGGQENIPQQITSLGSQSYRSSTQPQDSMGVRGQSYRSGDIQKDSLGFGSQTYRSGDIQKDSLGFGSQTYRSGDIQKDSLGFGSQTYRSGDIQKDSLGFGSQTYRSGDIQKDSLGFGSQTYRSGDIQKDSLGAGSQTYRSGDIQSISPYTYREQDNSLQFSNLSQIATSTQNYPLMSSAQKNWSASKSDSSESSQYSSSDPELLKAQLINRLQHFQDDKMPGDSNILTGLAQLLLNVQRREEELVQSGVSTQTAVSSGSSVYNYSQAYHNTGTSSHLTEDSRQSSATSKADHVSIRQNLLLRMQTAGITSGTISSLVKGLKKVQEEEKKSNKSSSKMQYDKSDHFRRPQPADSNKQTINTKYEMEKLRVQEEMKQKIQEIKKTQTALKMARKKAAAARRFTPLRDAPNSMGKPKSILKTTNKTEELGKPTQSQSIWGASSTKYSPMLSGTTTQQSQTKYGNLLSKFIQKDTSAEFKVPSLPVGVKRRPLGSMSDTALGRRGSGAYGQGAYGQGGHVQSTGAEIPFDYGSSTVSSRKSSYTTGLVDYPTSP